jgi:hypothetical protein
VSFGFDLGVGEQLAREHLSWNPFVLIGYSFVELYALHEVLIRGKKSL